MADCNNSLSAMRSPVYESLRATVGFSIESSNVVGYSTASFATKGDWYLNAVQFESVDGSAFCLQNLNSNLTGPAWDEEAEFTLTAPQMQVRNGDVYDLYYFLSDGAVDAEGNFIPGWADAGGNPLEEDVLIESGTAYWIYNPYEADTSMTVAGAVVSDDTVTQSFKVGYTLSASPFPAAVSFEEIAFAKIIGPAWDEEAEFTTTAPMMQVRNGNVYDLYYFLSDGAVDAEGNFIPGWADAGGNPLDDYSAKVIGSGAAFWVYLPEDKPAFTATFSL